MLTWFYDRVVVCRRRTFGISGNWDGEMELAPTTTSRDGSLCLTLESVIATDTLYQWSPDCYFSRAVTHSCRGSFFGYALAVGRIHNSITYIELKRARLRLHDYSVYLGFGGALLLSERIRTGRIMSRRLEMLLLGRRAYQGRFALDE